MFWYAHISTITAYRMVHAFNVFCLYLLSDADYRLTSLLHYMWTSSSAELRLKTHVICHTEQSKNMFILYMHHDVYE